MSLVSLKCPNCGGSIQMDTDKDTGFCLYCGGKFQTKDETQRILIEHSGAVEFSRQNEMRNLLLRAEEKISEYQGTSFAEIDILPQAIKIMDNYIEKILDIQADNPEALELKQRLSWAKDYKLKCYRKIRISNAVVISVILIIACLSCLKACGAI